jgi:hypothetical protein
MLVLGAQILLGFELSGVFRDGFASLPLYARYLDGIALLMMIIAIALLVTPESYHQIVDIGEDTGRFHRFISGMGYILSVLTAVVIEVPEALVDGPFPASIA